MNITLWIIVLSVGIVVSGVGARSTYVEDGLASAWLYLWAVIFLACAIGALILLITA